MPTLQGRQSVQAQMVLIAYVKARATPTRELRVEVKAIQVQ